MVIKDPISTNTLNQHLGWCSSFFDGSINYGYSDINLFKGMKLNRIILPRNERNRFNESDLKKIFGK